MNKTRKYTDVYTTRIYLLQNKFFPEYFSSVAQFCPTLCDPMNCSKPGLPVHHQLPEFTQTHVHRVGDAIQPSHPLLSPSPPAPQPPSITVFSNESNLRMRWPKYWSFSLTSFLPKNTQDWSPLEWTGWNSLQSKGLSRVFSNTTVQKHQFFGTQLSSQSNSHSGEPTTLTNYAWAAKTHSTRCLGWGTFRYSRGACGLRKWCKLLVLKFDWSSA